MDNRELFIKIAREVGLDEHTENRFVRYMLARWPNESFESYIKEWAERFKDNREYVCSDSIGQAVLQAIDKKG